ncbi:hypothetical protein ABGT92_07775 [Streptomyces cinereoruber]|uniref:hypothetical protein n=1 Tax=Streptomyces cinereoruber TaxID=67260 RepID=UPI00345D831E
MVQLWLIIAVSVVAGVAWKLYRYPGGWEYAFGLKYEDHRNALAVARGKLRAWTRAMNQSEAAARGGISSVEKSRTKRLHELEQRIAGLRNPGRGDRIDALGELTLFQRVLVVESATGSRSIAVASLDVRFEPGSKNHSVYCTDASGEVYRAKYPHHPPAPDLEEQRFDEDQVRDFVVKIQNAIAQENTFRARLPRQLKAAEAEWDETMADTDALDTARERLQQLQQRNRADPRGKAAEAEFTEAALSWKELTGRTPPR